MEFYECNSKLFFSVNMFYLEEWGRCYLRLETSLIQANWVPLAWNCRFKYLQIESESKVLLIFVQ
jgi:hypothetical protein